MTEYKPVSFCQINPCCSLDRLSPNPCCEVMHMMSSFSCVQLFATLCTIACQAPLSLGFPRQEYWSGLPFPPPGYLPDPGIQPASPALAGGAFPSEHQGSLLLLSRFSRVRLSATPRTVAYQSPLSVGFSRQESWSGLPLPSPGDLADPGIELRSPAL